jgi:hypothetical protein
MTWGLRVYYCIEHVENDKSRLNALSNVTYDKYAKTSDLII